MLWEVARRVNAPNGFFAPAAPTRSHPWRLRPQTPLVALNALVLKRRTG